jgi:tetratricopeptide (TPR) repeat protein
VPSLLTGVAELIEKALPLVSDDSLDAARMLSSYATALYMSKHDYDAAQRAFTRAEELARRHGERSLEVRVLVAAAGVDMYHTRFAEGAERAVRALELAQQEGDLVGMAAASMFGSSCLANAGDLERAEQCIRAGLEPAERLRDRTYRTRVGYLAAWVAWERGDFSAAREFCERGLTAAPGEARLLSTLAVVEAEAGNLDAAYAGVERLLAAWTAAGETDLGMALNGGYAGTVLALITQDADRAGTYAQVWHRVLSAPDVPEYYRQCAQTALGVIAVLRRDASSASERYLQLRASATGPHVYFMTVDRVLGLLARTMGDAQTAAGHFEDALAFCRKGGYRPELGWTCLDYAELLMDEPNSRLSSAISIPPPAAGGQERAPALLDEGLQIAQELGMRPLIERILGHRQILKA